MTEFNSVPSNTEEVKTMIIALEKKALELWNSGNPDGFLELSSEEVIYIDPVFVDKLVGKKALEEYYDTIRGKVKIDRYEMKNPVVQLASEVAVLMYDYEAYRDGQVFRMHCTEVYKLEANSQWKIMHTHWSFVMAS